MERNEDRQDRQVSAGFPPEDYERLVAAAHGTGRTPEDFVHDAAMRAAEDPFAQALADTVAAIAEMAPAFARADRTTHLLAEDGPDTPLSSRSLRRQHRRAA
ncbi:hypothetical protein [Streptomyces roseoverticillatus]|uniref:DUF1778 domain-containing protein n=1 Tax=Streptomyces roseoverticillatus TaxID=66429 RepID=A0ABV3J347_9ACTN